jgi:hypothetical protein
LHGFGSISFFVGILNAEDELSAFLACEYPIEERGTRATDVQIAGG